ncbi:hypothetical protein KQI49_14125 [Virgibacillus sp. MSJ-26]|nr:hypothetical protein [Virgibacillus sp. MSJ-26]MBU5467964.1 hypothetical protein [Virgibacillus sp. MSJ-26]
MKKLFVGTVLGVMLMGGFMSVQDSNQEDLAYELEPSILSVQKPVSFM